MQSSRRRDHTLPGSPVTHASEEAEHSHLRAKWAATLGPKADEFVARAMAQAAQDLDGEESARELIATPDAT